MHIVAPDALDELGGGPHADAPGVTRVRRRDNLIVPLERFLARDLPKVTGAPGQRLSVGLDQLCADAMCRIVIALVVSVPRAFARAGSNIGSCG
eukprot:scaffold10059_cov123-Isochrysis_galbana.AAC.11